MKWSINILLIAGILTSSCFGCRPSNLGMTAMQSSDALAALVLGCLNSAAADDSTQPGSEVFRIAGYLPDYRSFDAVKTGGLTDLIVFSAQPTESGDIDLSRLAKTNWAELREAKQKQKFRLILCIGGWERSTHFGKVAASEKLRHNFVTTAKRLCVEKQLDGIDLDWEHPHDAQEQDAYAMLLQDLQQALHPAGRSVSITMAAWQVLPRRAFELVDWIQVMAYDHPGRHSTFENAQSDIDKLIQAGAPRHKILLGLPFYGRAIERAQPALTYHEIVAKFRPGRAVDEIEGIYFNGPAMIQRKTYYALQSRLAGVMIWELGQDARGEDSLLNTILQACRKTNYRIEVQNKEDQVAIDAVALQPVFTVISAKGIGRAVVHRPTDGWPNEQQQIVVKLKLRGLEQLRVSAGELSWLVNVSSHDRKPTIRLQRGSNETEITNLDNRYWTDVKTSSDFEMKLPSAIFSDNPKSITIDWVDFYR